MKKNILPPDVSEENFCAAMKEWEDLLGIEYALRDEKAIDSYASCTLPQGRRASAVLKPQTVEQIQKILRQASLYKIPIYPISRGLNWGYGSACPVVEGNCILDLSRMDKIIEVNEELAYAVVEPGVTQTQLSQYLRDRHILLWMDVTGAPPEASLIGNALERGWGHSPYGDHFWSNCGMEIILADGRILKTGFGHYKGAQAKYVFKYGTGPYLDGIFTQSNFGIVVKMGVWLMPQPEQYQSFFFKVKRDEDIYNIIECLRPLMLKGCLKSTIHIANDLRAISQRQAYPFEETQGIRPLPEDIQAMLRHKYGLGYWNGCGALYGSKAEVSSSQRALKRNLSPYADLYFFTDARLQFSLTVLRKIFRIGKLVEKLALIKPLHDLMKGIPTAEPLKGLYWRNQRKLRGDEKLAPLNDNCGGFWCSPILPARARDVKKLLALVKPIYQHYGFEFFVTLTFPTGRSLIAVLSIFYDKDNSQETTLAMECYQELNRILYQEGFIPYRTSILSMSDLTSGSECFWGVVKQIKDALDPKGIIAPGRYDPLHPVEINNL